MKKIIVLFFIFNLTTTLGQSLSYTATGSYSYVTCAGSGLNCSTSYINYSFSGASGQDQILNSSNPTISKVYSSIPLASTYTFSSSGCYCLYNNGTVQVLPVPSSGTQSIGNLIQNNNANLLLTGCFGNAFFSGFKPNNMTVQNLGSTSTVCAGEQLNMVALPAGYPPEAYNWQYSIDNQITWITVPKKMINGISTNNTTTSNFSIYDIFGADHINHFGSIYFRIGYSGRPSFSASSIKINYSPCAPLVTNVDYVGPKCNGDGIEKLDIYFKDPLDVSKNESLYQLYLRETTNNTGIIKTTPFMLVSDVTYSSISKVYSYTNFSSFSSLENGREYEIIYQAQVKHPTDANPSIKILKGVLIGPNPFRYREPDPLKFEIKKADNPKCPDNLVEVAISVSGGTGDYKFYVDGIEKTNPKPIKEADEYYHIRGLIPTAINSIKVTDENNCIEKSL